MVNRTLGLKFVSDQYIFKVKLQHAELFGFAMCHSCSAIGNQRVPTAYNRASYHLRLRQPVGSRLNYLKLTDHRITDAGHL